MATSQRIELVPPSAEGRAVLAKFFRAVGDLNRLALLEFLADEERTGTDCVAHLGLAQSRVSAHLACLVTCGVVTLRREGHFAYYRVADSRVLELVGLGAEVASDNAAEGTHARVGTSA
ncbi:MAG: ArsR/SmtB family transcription factor [Acidimicrobiales bacterium]